MFLGETQDLRSPHIRYQNTYGIQDVANDLWKHINIITGYNYLPD